MLKYNKYCNQFVGLLFIQTLQARPPGIYKGHYLQELAERYGGGVSDISIPERPQWCFDNEEEDPSHQVKSKGKKRYGEFQNEV